MMYSDNIPLFVGLAEQYVVGRNCERREGITIWSVTMGAIKSPDFYGKLCAVGTEPVPASFGVTSSAAVSV